MRIEIPCFSRLALGVRPSDIFLMISGMKMGEYAVPQPTGRPDEAIRNLTPPVAGILCYSRRGVRDRTHRRPTPKITLLWGNAQQAWNELGPTVTSARTF
jgi:hypothetical protein